MQMIKVGLIRFGKAWTCVQVLVLLRFRHFSTHSFNYCNLQGSSNKVLNLPDLNEDLFFYSVYLEH